MGENSAISWTDHTFNPWWGCTKVGPGCDHCYAESFDKRVGGAHWGAGAPRRLIKDWSKPRKWQREAERTGVRPWVFCASMADVFDNEVPTEWRDRLWQLVRETPDLNWIFVTKRIGNAAKMLPADWPDAFPHCGICITVVNQEEADRDVPKLLRTAAAWRGLSMEPLLGSVQLRRLRISRGVQLDALTGLFDAFTSMLGGFATAQQAIAALPSLPARLPALDWVIVGGESGARARPMHPRWAADVRDQCASIRVSFHFKQWGEWVAEAQSPDDVVLPSWSREHWPDDPLALWKAGKKAAGRLLDGDEHNGMPPSPALPLRQIRPAAVPSPAGGGA